MEEYLSKHKLFNGIKIADIPHLLNCLNASYKTYQKDEIVFNVSQSKRYIGIILEGSINIVIDDFYGNRFIVNEVSPPNSFGEALAFSEFSNNFYSIAKEKTKILIIPSDKINEICNKVCSFHLKISTNLLKIISNKNTILNQHLEIISKKNIREKLLAYLSIQMLKQKSSYLTINFSREELADYLSVNRSALSREISKLKDEGIIDYYKNTFRVFKNFSLNKKSNED